MAGVIITPSVSPVSILERDAGRMVISLLGDKKFLLLLHFGFFVQSFSAVFLKLASGEEPMSFYFFVFYGMALGILFVYAVFWQFILRSFSLSTAFSNRGVVVAWGILWGGLIFDEYITAGKLAAAALIIAGIVVLGKANV